MSDPRFEAFGEPEDKLVEECAELIKAISKAKRFGWKEFHPASRGSDYRKGSVANVREIY